MFNLNKIKKRVGDVARQAAQAFAITNDRPAVEVYKELWKSVQTEHNDLVNRNINLDDPKLLSKTNIPENLDHMVSILIREDEGRTRESSSNQSSHGPIRPCLEYTLENRVFIDLCAKGLADRPKGMMSLILVTILHVIEKVRHPLLPYKSAHQPLSQLIRVTAEVGDSFAKERLVALLKSLWIKMRNDSSQLEFFYTPPTANRPEELDMFVALLPFILEPSEAGEKARYAVLCASSICDTHLLQYMASKTQFAELVANGLNRWFVALVDAVTKEQNQASEHDGDQQDHHPTDGTTRRVIIAAKQELMIVWRFANALSIPGISVGLGLTKNVEDEDEDAEGGDNDDEKGDNSNDSNINEVGGTSAGEDEFQIYSILSNTLVEQIHNKFFLQTVLPSLMETSESKACSAMLAVCELLDALATTGQALQSPLLWKLVTMLIPTGELGPDTRDLDNLKNDNEDKNDMEKKLQTILLFRLDSMASNLSTGALKLYSKLLDLNDPRILNALVLRQLYPGNHLEIDEGRLQEIQESSESSDADLQTPVKQSRKSMRPGEAVEFLEKYPGSPKPPAIGSSKQRKTISTQERQELLAFEAYLTDGQGEAAAKIAAFATNASAVYAKQTSPKKRKNRRHSAPPGLESSPSEPFSEGLFIALVFNKLERMLDSTLEENLLLTGILAKLAQCPHRILHCYLYDEPILDSEFVNALNGKVMLSTNMDTDRTSGKVYRLKPNIRSLSSVLASVWKEALERVDDLMPAFENYRSTVRASLGVDRFEFLDKPVFRDNQQPNTDDNIGLPPVSPNQDDDLYSLSKKRFVQGYVVLEEFLKELASILQAKTNLLSLQQDLNGTFHLMNSM